MNFQKCWPIKSTLVSHPFVFRGELDEQEQEVVLPTNEFDSNTQKTERVEIYASNTDLGDSRINGVIIFRKIAACKERNRFKREL